MRADTAAEQGDDMRSGAPERTGARIPAGVFAGGAILLVTYVATLAPGLTFWDAGEFIAAVHTFGIPHPPGTPLYIAIARAWSGLLPAMNTATAVNLLSAVATAAACIAGAFVVAARDRSATHSGLPRARDFPSELSAVLVAGAMSTVWLNATEAEVYAPSLLLSALMVFAGYRASRAEGLPWVLLTGYLFALSSPLHLGALVAAPAAIVLASSRVDGFRRERVLPLAAAACAAAALSLGSPLLGVMAVLALVTSVLLPGAGRGTRAWLAFGTAVVVLIALSAQLILLARAVHDPAINQGNPATIDALLAVITREQYAVAPLWPRQAPLWMQLANFLEYVDWQVALGLAPGVAPSPWRTPFTLLFIALGFRGAGAHRQRDRPTWRAIALLLACATVGVVLQLNLKAGPSFGYGILPDEAPHEPRERDYFFALAFWAWGLWAGLGAVAASSDLAQRLRLRGRWGPGAGIALASLPLVLNWRAVDRNALPDATLPRTFAIGILESAPPNAVLFTWGDNDTYPLWYAREVEGLRRDVTLVTVPLLPADWYRVEIARRTGLLEVRAAESWLGQDVTIRRIANAARAAGRPLAVVITMPAAERETLSPAWAMRGFVFVPATGNAGEASVDLTGTRAAAERVAHIIASGPARASTDPTARYVRALMECPRAALAAHDGGGGAREAVNSLAPVCNLR